MDLMTNALWITLIGMGLTFGALALFWGVMWAITALPVKEVTQKLVPDGDGILHHEEDKDQRAKAAAVAVTIALAEQEQQQTAYFPMPETAFVSAWQLGMRTRQMYQKGSKSK